MKCLVHLRYCLSYVYCVIERKEKKCIKIMAKNIAMLSDLHLTHLSGIVHTKENWINQNSSSFPHHVHCTLLMYGQWTLYI